MQKTSAHTPEAGVGQTSTKRKSAETLPWQKIAPANSTPEAGVGQTSIDSISENGENVNIRKSLKDTVRTQKYLLEATRQLRKTVDLRKQEFKRTAGHKLNEAQMETFSKRILRQTHSSYDLQTLTENLTAVFTLTEASNGGAIELARGTYQEMRKEYERAHEQPINTLYEYSENIETEQGRNPWDLQFIGNGRNDGGNGTETSGEGLSTDAAGDDEYLRGRNQGTSAGKENIRKSLKDTVRTQKDILEENRQLRKTVDLRKQEFKLTAGHKLNAAQMETLSKRILRQTHSSYDLQMLTENLTAVFTLMEASNGGAIELARGTYQEMRKEYERAHEQPINTLYEYSENIETEQGRNPWDLQFIGNGRNDGGNGTETSGEGLSTDAAGDDEYLRGRNQGTSAGKENIRKSLKDTVRTQKYLLEAPRQLRKTVDLRKQEFKLTAGHKLNAAQMETLSRRPL